MHCTVHTALCTPKRLNVLQITRVEIQIRKHARAVTRRARTGALATWPPPLAGVGPLVVVRFGMVVVFVISVVVALGFSVVVVFV